MSNMWWRISEIQLARTHAEMCAINQTPRKEQSAAQTQRLNDLRAVCVSIHHWRIELNQERLRVPAASPPSGSA